MTASTHASTGAARSTFRSLHVRNYRLYWTGQLVSLLGTWISLTAVSWMVLTELDGGGTDVGLLAAAQFAPTLLFGTWAGVLADRLPLRRVLIVTQTALLLVAAAMAALTMTGAIRLWMVFPLVAAQGVVTAFDNPARQSFVSELVPRDLVANAVALNSVGFNCARIVGPGIAGALILLAGTSSCFVLNTLSFLGALGALAAIREEKLHPRPRAGRASGQIRAGLRHATEVPVLRTTLLTMAVVGTVSMNFTVLIPLLARTTFHASAGTFGLLSTAMGAGSLGGALFAARQSRPTLQTLSRAALAVGLGMIATAASPTLLVASITIALTGACVMTFLATTNSLLQLHSRADMRGRVLSLYLVLFIGTSPLGGPVVGWIAQQFGARTSFAYGAAGALVGALVAYRSRHASDRVEQAPFTDIEEEVATSLVPRNTKGAVA